MACRDRTRDFTLAIRTLQPQQNGTVKEPFKRNMQQASSFMPVARQLSKDISNTFAKLEKLTLLASKRSLFEDNNDEVQQLTFIIKQDIQMLNKQIEDLQHLSTWSSKSNKQCHSNSIVLSLQTHLADMSKDFKSVLEVRTKNMKKQKERRQEFSSTPLLPPPSHNPSKSVLLHEDQVSISMEPHHQQQQIALISQQDAYIESRADAMLNVEQTIVELGAIFQQLATMVHQQEDVVHRIDSHVDETTLNIDAGHTELVKYFRSVTNNRWLMLKIFAILIVFFIIFIVFLA